MKRAMMIPCDSWRVLGSAGMESDGKRLWRERSVPVDGIFRRHIDGKTFVFGATLVKGQWSLTEHRSGGALVKNLGMAETASGAALRRAGRAQLAAIIRTRGAAFVRSKIDAAPSLRKAVSR